MHLSLVLVAVQTLATISSVAADYFYYGSSCTGDRVLVLVSQYSYCYGLVSGYAASIYATQGTASDTHVAFQPSSANAYCGYAVCTAIIAGGSCCSAANKNIKGLAVYSSASCVKSCARDTDDKDQDDMTEHFGEPLEMPPDGGPEVCILTSDAGEVQIELSDGSYFGLGVGRPTPFAEEVQEELKSAGRPALSAAKIAQLRADELVK